MAHAADRRTQWRQNESVGTSRAQKKGQEEQEQKGRQSKECGIGRGRDQPASSER